MNSAITFPTMLAGLIPAWLAFFEPAWLLKLFAATVSFCLYAGMTLGLIFVIHFLFSQPVRRAERARLFLDLLEDAFQRGQPVEEMILSLAQSRDRTVGVRFHMIAAYIEKGLHFGEALKKVPRFLPPQVSAMLLAGEKMGDLKKVLPACRETLRERPAGVRSATHYMLLVVFFFSPMFIGVVLLTATFVIPRFKEVAAGMNVQLWPLTLFVFANTSWFVVFEVCVSVFLFLAVLFYVGGPQLGRCFQFVRFPITDWIAWRIPWKQKRLQRTFSAMLAVLLDNGVPEVEAIRLAGESTANEICRRRTRRIIAELEKGAKLVEAVRLFDPTGEFRWRLKNAVHAQEDFLPALRGWHETLDAKAFQQEEATAHVLTSGLVVLNGVLVALIVTAMFGIIIAVLNGMLAAT